ncbi:hypothetical protein KFU94_52295 [Chloroflexi bacterium TSY]|nr:hypothetical protein [Chloroflexi bacterium TSY]
MVIEIDTQTPEANFGKISRGNHKILIAYASQFGTTGEVAGAIGDTLSQEGHMVETEWVKNVRDIDEYDAVVIGSAIQYDRWMSEATDFVIANQNILSKMPVAYFFTCMTLSTRNEKTERQAMGYADKLYSLAPDVKPLEIGRFAGAVDLRKMPFFLRLFFGGLLFVRGVHAGDYRDWDAIRISAKSIERKLTHKQS